MYTVITIVKIYLFYSISWLKVTSKFDLHLHHQPEFMNTGCRMAENQKVQCMYRGGLKFHLILNFKKIPISLNKTKK